MRLMDMNLRARCLPALFAACLFAMPLAASAQNVAGAAGTGDPFKDTSSFKLAPGEKVSLLEFEDLECPACAHAAPIVKTAIDHYKIPFLRHDFLIPGHYWSKDAAITARYLQDKVNPDVAEQYRRDVFATQTSISSKDDLQAYTRRWFDQHHLQMPFVVDPTGRFALEIEQDVNLANRIGIGRTPTIVVLGPKSWTQVTDITQLYSAIDGALAQTPVKAAPAVKSGVKKPASAQK